VTDLRLALLRLAALLSMLAAAPAVLRAGATAAPLPQLDAATRLLVVSPHPDDETLCCAGLMQRVLSAGGSVSVVWLTSGDGSALSMALIERRLFSAPAAARDLGTRRMGEARAAVTALGVPATTQLFLGYPDGGLTALLTANRTSPYRARFTGAEAVPYAQALFPGHPYTGASLARDLAAVLTRCAPTLVLAPSPRDSHPDHRAAGLLTAQLLRQHSQALLRYWIVHGGEGWPSPRQLEPGLPLTPAPRMQGVAQLPFDLTPAEEDRKLKAVKAYDTQLEVLAPLLLAFVRSSELYTAP
jgi:LmbE family N-acetylglucosaminyl deacetylase